VPSFVKGCKSVSVFTLGSVRRGDSTSEVSSITGDFTVNSNWFCKQLVQLLVGALSSCKRDDDLLGVVLLASHDSEGFV
jgi:hypothetical protein